MATLITNGTACMAIPKGISSGAGWARVGKQCLRKGPISSVLRKIRRLYLFKSKRSGRVCSFIGTGSLVGVDIIIELPAIPDHHHVQHLLAGGILQPWIIYVIHYVFHTTLLLKI